MHDEAINWLINAAPNDTKRIISVAFKQEVQIETHKTHGGILVIPHLIERWHVTYDTGFEQEVPANCALFLLDLTFGSNGERLPKGYPLTYETPESLTHLYPLVALPRID